MKQNLSFLGLLDTLQPEAQKEHRRSGVPTVEIIYAYLWPIVQEQVREVYGDAAFACEEPMPKVDKRTRPWQYVIRFWESTETGWEMLAESDPERIDSGTGEIPGLIARYAKEMHDGFLPAELGAEITAHVLPQLRINLGRADTATLRLEYTVPQSPKKKGGKPPPPTRHLCQLDVFRLENGAA
jgi:hypothetical protein